MANKYTRKGQKEAITGESAAKPDEFVSFWERAYRWAQPHMRGVLIAAGGAVAVLVAIWAFNGLTGHAREDATEMFGRAVRIYEADLLEPPADDKEGKDAKAAKDAPKPAAGDKKADELPRFLTAKERAEAVVTELEKVEKEHGMTAVARQARMFRAGVLYDLAHYEQAEALYKKAFDEAAADDPLRAVAQEGLGLSQESHGRLDEALGSFKSLESYGAFYRDRALYNQGRVLMAKGDKAGAQDAYQKLLKDAPESSLRDDAQNRLALMGVKPVEAAAPPAAPADPTKTP